MTIDYIQATNQVGYNVELLEPVHGWRAVGFCGPYETRGEAVDAMKHLQAAAPGREFRVYPALAGKA